jgi:peptidylprolyl isomerase
MKTFLFVIAIAGILSTGSAPRGFAQTSEGSPASKASSTTDKSGHVTFENVTVDNAANLSARPKVTSESTLPAARLKVKDLVVGTGEAANPSSSVTVQYVGVRYADGKQFDSSWEKGGPITFRLNKVVRGFTQGIGGNDTVSPMKVGGRRVMIIPSELGYGENGTPDGSIPPNATIVFVVDLKAVK